MRDAEAGSKREDIAAGEKFARDILYGLKDPRIESAAGILPPVISEEFAGPLLDDAGLPSIWPYPAIPLTGDEASYVD